MTTTATPVSRALFRRGRMPFVLVTLVAYVTLAFTAMLSMDAASAHSDLVSSTPAEGASVAEFTEFSLTFGDAITPEFSSFSLTDQMGMTITLGTPVYDSTNTVATVPLASLAGGGTYVIGYSVLSIDGHTIAGTINFTSTAPTMGGHDMGDGGHTPPPFDADHTRPPHAEGDRDHDDMTPGDSDLNLAGLWYALIGAGVGAVIVALIAWMGKRRRAKAARAAEFGADASGDATSVAPSAQDKPRKKNS